MNTVNVLNLERISEADRARIEAVDPRVRLVHAAGWFDGEIRLDGALATPLRPIEAAPNAGVF